MELSIAMIAKNILQPLRKVIECRARRQFDNNGVLRSFTKSAVRKKRRTAAALASLPKGANFSKKS
jgi:hypothetical protein